jgi:uncharacterized protein
VSSSGASVSDRKGIQREISKGWNCIVELPPRREYEAVAERNWRIEVHEGVDFEGQHFSFPEGLFVKAQVQWLEESLLSVRMSLSARVEGKCARCLADASLAISDDLMYLYYLRGLEVGKDTSLPSDEGYMPVEIDFWGRILNLSDQVWESLLVLLPLKLLCREECAGLCPHCGADLNDGPCSCDPQERDPRLEILRSFSLDDV